MPFARTGHNLNVLGKKSSSTNEYLLELQSCAHSRHEIIKFAMTFFVFRTSLAQTKCDNYNHSWHYTGTSSSKVDRFSHII